MSAPSTHIRKTKPRRYNTSVLAAERDLLGLTNRQIALAIRRDDSVVSRTLAGAPQYQGAQTVRAIAEFLRVPMVRLQIQPEVAA